MLRSLTGLSWRRHNDSHKMIGIASDNSHLIIQRMAHHDWTWIAVVTLEDRHARLFISAKSPKQPMVEKRMATRIRSGYSVTTPVRFGSLMCFIEYFGSSGWFWVVCRGHFRIKSYSDTRVGGLVETGGLNSPKPPMGLFIILLDVERVTKYARMSFFFLGNRQVVRQIRPKCY